MDRGALDNQLLDSPAFLAGELQQVEQEMRAALSDLRPPFTHLVQNQWRDGAPLLCAAFVLTAGVRVPDDPRLAQQRIHLGAAIEVLRLALAVHTNLLRPADPLVPIERSLLGSTVLAGDFCFSRAAGLAARTGSPIVVDIFAQALQRVSEGTLRGLFNAAGSSAEDFDAEHELCLSGVAAANELAGLSAEERELDQRLALLLLSQRPSTIFAAPWTPSTALPLSLAEALSPKRREHWEALLDWLHRR